MARLQIFKTVRNLRLANPHAKFFGFVERYVGVSVTQLHKMGLARAGGRDREVGLQVKVQVIADVATQYYARSTDEEGLIIAPRAVRM